MSEACSWLDPVHSRAEFPPMACWAIRRNSAHRATGECLDVPCDHVDADAGSVPDTICLPLAAQNGILGLLYFEWRPQPSSRETPDVYLKMLAENVGLALDNLRLRDALREMAMADPLTTLANRRQLDAELDHHLAVADRERTPISCVMVDVDHFKRFNDDHGHDAGDAVLRAVAATLRHSTREGHAFRYGGEEFLLLMPGFSAEDAAARAEDIRQRIAALRVHHDGRELGQITASLGVATAPTHCQSTRLVQAADAALLRAKRDGRDRVAIARNRRIEKAAG
jgi:diguanylate cyclase (GGDEF)-like protein